jgi:hypothetical protein
MESPKGVADALLCLRLRMEDAIVTMDAANNALSPPSLSLLNSRIDQLAAEIDALSALQIEVDEARKRLASMVSRVQLLQAARNSL